MRAVMKDERIVAWRVSDRKVKASLQARRVIKKSDNYIKTNQHQELRSLSQMNHRFS